MEFLFTVPFTRISIHALLAESDPYAAAAKLDRFQFLSTLSLRRATPHRTEQGICRDDFYPRSPCGERLLSLHIFVMLDWHFYPRSPCGERHGDWIDSWDSGDISIHALLAESDGAL